VVGGRSGERWSHTVTDQVDQTPEDAWYQAYAEVYDRIPDRAHRPCLNCGADALQLVFTADADERIGYASLWCDNCLRGLVLS